jgi:hypothetical protein
MKTRRSFPATFLRNVLLFSILTLPYLSVSQTSRRSTDLTEREEISKPARLNQKSFQKNLEKYAQELDLSSRQVKKLNRIERKFTRKETKLARRPSTKKRHLRSLQKEKREQMIAVLSYEQQQKLQRLSKSNFWDFIKFKE